MSTKPFSLIFLIFLSNFTSSSASGFSVDLIHRDSLHQSSNSSINPYERMRKVLLRSHNRVQSIAHSYYTPKKDVSTDILSESGEYLMKFSIGNPPVETTAVADTGSDLIWIQCQPCIQCFKQDIPIFEPRRSSSYKTVPCRSMACYTANVMTTCNNNTCGYQVLYGDRSYSRGDIATERITLGGGKPTQNILFGCGHMNRGTFSSGTTGIVGLGGGKVSLVSQLGNSIRHKFSYCLKSRFTQSTSNSSSKLHFGQNAVVSGPGVVSTPLVRKNPKTYYFLTLEGITVGNERLNFLGSDNQDPFSSKGFRSWTAAGNIIIDSGTTLTYLPAGLYGQVRRAVKEQMRLPAMRDPLGMLETCFRWDGREDAHVPLMIMHFKGADVTLKAENMYVETGDESLCLAFVAATSIAIYGNIAQANFLVGYDLARNRVSFKPTDCAVGK